MIDFRTLSHCVVAAFVFLMATPIDVSAKEMSLVTGDQEIKIYGMSPDEFKSIEYHPEKKADAGAITGAIVAALHEAGYVSAEGFVISDKEIFLNQGAITVVQIFGLTGKAKDAANRVARRLIGKRPNINELDTVLADINALSGVDATFALEASKNKIMDPRGWTPEDNTSHYTLIVKAAEQAQQYGAISLDSTPRNLFERNRATMTQTVNSVLVGGDHIQGSFTHIWGDGQAPKNEGSVTYFAPLMDNGLYAELYGSYSASKNEVSPNVERDFQGTTFTGTIGYPVHRAHDETLTIIAGLGYQGEDQQGQPNAHVKAATSTLFYNHSDPEGNSVTSGVTITSGHATSQSTTRENGAFSHLRMGAGYIHSLRFIGDDTELRLEGFAQVTRDALPSAQRFILGGTDFLRGYPSGVYSGNNGAAGTVELGHKYFFENKYLTGMSVKAFWDFGFVSNKAVEATSRNRPKHKAISSVGLAYSGDLAQGAGISGWLGVPLNKGNQGEDLGLAVYLKLTKGW